MRCGVFLIYLAAIQLIVTIFSPQYSLAQDILVLNGTNPIGDNSLRKITRKSDKKINTTNKLRPLQTMRSIDEETELLLKEVLNLGSDLAILMDKKNNPYPFQVLVLVSLAKMKYFDLQEINLKIDQLPVATYKYTASDNTALLKGGSHRLYLANLAIGFHTLTAEVIGKFSSNIDYKLQIDYIIVSGVSRTVLEINISPTNRTSIPKLAVKEWN